MKLGLVTYNIAPDWDLPTLLRKCEAAGFAGVELRTTHAHGVEPTLTPEQRRQVREMFAQTSVELVGLGSVCEYDSPDEAEVRRNIEETKQFICLARDVGARGVKVRPNKLHVDKGIAIEDTLAQIGRALRECGDFAAQHGIELWLEVHGAGTSHPPHIRDILEEANHPNVGACWNSNMTDLDEDGRVEKHFAMLRPWIRHVHINNLYTREYPWQVLFNLLKEMNYTGYTMAEIPSSADPDTVLQYYRALWEKMVA